MAVAPVTGLAQLKAEVAALQTAITALESLMNAGAFDQNAETTIAAAVTVVQNSVAKITGLTNNLPGPFPLQV